MFGLEQQFYNFILDEVRVFICEVVWEMFFMFGLKVDDFIEVQKDFQYLCEWCSIIEILKCKILLIMFGIVVLGMVGVFVMGVKEIFSK